MLSRLGALRVSNPDQWAKEVARAMKAARGNVGNAAESLGVSKRQLMRWLAELPEVPRSTPGRPRGTMVERDAKQARKSEKRRWRRWESNPPRGVKGFEGLRDSAGM